MTIETILTDYPLVIVALGIVLRAALAWQSSLSWREYRTLHGLKRLVFPVLDRRAPVVSWYNPKRGRDDPEYLRTVEWSVRKTARELSTAGGDLHLLCSLKRRPADHGDAVSAAHVVFLHPDDTQTEAYLFRNDDGTTDVYVHHEPDPSRPLAHLGGDNQSDGDVRGVVTAALPTRATVEVDA